MVVPVLPAFAAQWGAGAFGIGLLVAAPSLARLVLNNTAGRMVDSRGRVPMMVGGALIAVGQTVILPAQPPRPLVGVSIVMERERQQNDSLANG